MCKLEEVKDLLIDFIEEETEDGLECTNGQELGMAIDMVKDLSKAMYHFKLIEAMDTTYGIENLERHIKCLRKMAENLCHEKGITTDEAKQAIMSMFKQN